MIIKFEMPFGSQLPKKWEEVHDSAWFFLFHNTWEAQVVHEHDEGDRVLKDYDLIIIFNVN